LAPENIGDFEISDFGSLGCWFNTGIGQNALDGISTEVVTKIPECTAQSRVAPNGVCGGHLNNEFDNVCLG
jgi:hypothetical protein